MCIEHSLPLSISLYLSLLLLFFIHVFILYYGIIRTQTHSIWTHWRGKKTKQIFSEWWRKKLNKFGTNINIFQNTATIHQENCVYKIENGEKKATVLQIWSKKIKKLSETEKKEKIMSRTYFHGLNFFRKQFILTTFDSSYACALPLSHTSLYSQRVYWEREHKLLFYEIRFDRRGKNWDKYMAKHMYA